MIFWSICINYNLNKFSNFSCWAKFRVFFLFENRPHRNGVHSVFTKLVENVFERGVKNNGKTRRATFFCNSSGEMSLGKCKLLMGDVIREFKSGARNGHISWTNAIPTSKFPLSQWNLSPFRLTPLPTHFVMGRKSPIETIVNGILHRPYGKSL